MHLFERWSRLNRCLELGALEYIDLAFAGSVLKKLKSVNEDHAALLALLFALLRQGHLTLDISKDALSTTLRMLGIEESLGELVVRGAATFPQQGLAEVREGDPTPSAWVCRLGNTYYLQRNWVYETEILKHLHRLHQSTPAIVFAAGTIDPRLNAAQREALEKGRDHPISLLTGGPGTGKTFTAAEIVKMGMAKQLRILLTAPTGKAVAQLEANLKRDLGSTASFRSGTLHAILGIKTHLHEEEEILPLFADLIIVDECSMIDAKIFSRLLAAVPNGARLVLIGDKNQLPPVEAGSIFADILDAGIFPATYLTESLRSDRQEILRFARDIQQGNVENSLQFLTENKGSDVLWTDLQESRQPCEDLWECYKDRYPSYHLEKPQTENILKEMNAFSLLSCMRQGSLGVDAINRYFLHRYCSQAPLGAWWIAPILITRNDAELELYNGDLGFLVRKMTRDISSRQFQSDDYACFFDRKGGARQIAALALGAFEYRYCLSVHKSQGSEYDEVVILVPKGSELFGREVLYTAVTRAKKKVVLAADRDLLQEAIAHSSRKLSGLTARLGGPL